MQPYIVVMVIGLALLFVWRWSSDLSRMREKEIEASRPSETAQTFVTSFRPEAQPIARAMYIELQQYTSSGKVPFRKTDRIVEILRIEKIDLDEALQHVADQFGWRKPTKQDYSKFPKRETFEDCVEFIHHLRTS